MTGVYSVEDLLKLRASPLICKPPSLPPIEEWMGTQEPVSKRPTTRGRQDDSNLQTEGFQKRPTLDPSLRKSTTDPERIVLGPPRRSFASSNARNLGKAGTIDSQDTQKEGTARHERTKTGDDLENKFADRRSGQFGGVNIRSGNRHEQDHDRPRRRYDDEDGEAKPRREHDRPRWGREEKAIEEVDENGNIKSGSKRDSQARSRFEQSWLRGDRGNSDAHRENDRSGWRRDRVKDGDWDTPGKGDVDPEWMDEPDTAEPAQAHTQEDFQRWKERMKAAANGPIEEKQSIPAAMIASADGDAKHNDSALQLGLTSPDLNVNSMDKFFAKFNEKKPAADDKGSGTPKPATKSKFASLFGPTAEPKPIRSPEPIMPIQPIAAPVPAPAPSHVQASALAPAPPIKSSMSVEQAISSIDADQAGFKRILEMLGKRDTTPVTDVSQKLNSSGKEQQIQERNQSPDLVALFKQAQPPRHTPVSQPPPGLEGLVESRSPVEGHRRQETPNKDELLLNLLRQADISGKGPQQPQRELGESRPPPGLFASMSEPSRKESRHIQEARSEVDRQIPMQQRGNSRSIFDDPAISGLSYQDEVGARQGLTRRPTNGYEDPYFDRIRQEQKPMQAPSGMVRPPGLEQMSRAPPGWPGQPPPPHQQQRQGPPPGINMPRGMQPPFVGPQQGPMPPMPQQGQRPPQRKYTGESNLPNFPPGIGPPPGFMNNGPPPGFHHSNTPSQNQNYGRYAMGDVQGPPQQGPPNMGRAFMEMYGNVERGGLRSGNGGVPLPPGFR